MKILLLDDQGREFIRFRIAVEGAGSSLTIAETPAEADHALEVGTFDVLLLDGILGVGLYGPDVLRDWISRGIKLPPVYMVSSDKEMQQRGIEAGAVAALDKKFLFEGDLKSLEELLEK